MTENNLYSKELQSLLESAIVYQKKLSVFFKIDEELKLRDLKKILKDKEFIYYALKVIENTPNNFIHKLLDELIYIILYDNISNSHIAKKIILESNTQLFREDLCRILLFFSIKEKNNIETIKDIALFLYELKYKKELLQFVSENMLALIQSEFIENKEDLKELYDLEDSSNG